MSQVMDIQEIMALIPHRYPFLLVDKVVSIDLGNKITAIKNITMNEPFFNGHFPGHPVMPGVLMIEAMAQAGGLLAYKSTNTKSSDGIMYYFAGINNARFKRMVVPGDQLRMEVVIIKSKRDIWMLEGQAFVGDELACSVEFMFARKVAE